MKSMTIVVQVTKIGMVNKFEMKLIFLQKCKLLIHNYHTNIELLLFYKTIKTCTSSYLISMVCWI
jgi:hypothetical protein